MIMLLVFVGGRRTIVHLGEIKKQQEIIRKENQLILDQISKIAVLNDRYVGEIKQHISTVNGQTLEY
jgi:hypothetical protein